MAEPNEGPSFLNNPALRQFLSSVAMRLVAYLAGLLIGAGIITQEQFDIIRESAVLWVAGGFLALLSLAYGLYSTYVNRRKIMKAMALPMVVTEDELEQRIKVGGAPSIATPKHQMPGPSTTPRPETP